MSACDDTDLFIAGTRMRQLWAIINLVGSPAELPQVEKDSGVPFLRTLALFSPDSDPQLFRGTNHEAGQEL